MNNKDLEQRITNAEQELAEMRKLLKENTWQVSDIVPGTMIKADGHSKSVILCRGYADSYDGEQRFYIGGLNSNPFDAYSTFTASGATKKQLVDYLNEYSHTNLGIMTTNF